MKLLEDLVNNNQFLTDVESYAQYLYSTESYTNIAQCWIVAVEQEAKRRGYVVEKIENTPNIIPLRRS
jgi:hypothetical protein